MAQRNLAGALELYNESLSIRKQLSKSNPSDMKALRAVSVSYQNVGDVQRAQGDVASALLSYQNSLAINKRLVKSDPSNAGWQLDLSIAFEKVGHAQVALRQLLSALKSYSDGAVVLSGLAGAYPANARFKSDIVSAAARIGNVSYELVLARDFANALQAADQSIALAPGTIWLYSGRAYALMFLGRTEEARTLFLKYRGQQDGMSKGELWEKTILGDFADLRKAGLTDPLMDEIERTLSSSG